MEPILRINAGTPMTETVLAKYIRKNDNFCNRYKKLWDAYNNDYQIYKRRNKASWKPDNRVSVNFARFIVDTFEGFFLGNPVKISGADEDAVAYAEFVSSYNSQDDTDAELSTIVSIFGRGYELYFVDEDGEIQTAELDPMEAFMIYDESLKPKPLYFVRTYTGSDRIRRGSISDGVTVRYFTVTPSVRFTGEEHPHGFDGVPAVEFVQNRARRGIFEDVLPLIDEYNKALSEKANDVDAFADAYLKILGAKLDEATIKFIRDNRVISFPGNAKDLAVEFMQKPDADATQEHLLERIERLIFTVAMVCNISDDNFATTSGIALKYKMMPMLNLMRTKERKFAGAFARRWKLIFSNPVSGMNADAWATLKFQFTPNYPPDIADEAKTAGALLGVTSKRTALSVLSVVKSPDEELERIEQEDDISGGMPVIRDGQ